MPGGKIASSQQKLDELLLICRKEVIKQHDASVSSLSCMPSDAESWSCTSRELLKGSSTQANRAQIVDKLDLNSSPQKTGEANASVVYFYLWSSEEKYNQLEK